MDKIKKKIEIKFHFFSTFQKITVGGFVNQLIKKFWPYSKTCLKRPLKSKQTKILMTNGSLLKVESIAECSPWSILQYF